MIYLGSLNAVNVLKKVVTNFTPELIYLICYLGKPDDYKLDSRFLDREIDCKKLEKLDITIFQKPVHLHRGICELTTPGKTIFNELIIHKVCQEIRKIFNDRDENGNATCNDSNDFNIIFQATFSFEINPSHCIEEKLIELSEKYSINMAPDNHENYLSDGSYVQINYSVQENNLIASLLIKCTCSHAFNHEIMNIEEYLKSYTLIKCRCECGKIFSFDPSLYFSKIF